MSDNLTKSDVVAGTAPRSDQLNADDLLTGPVTVTITAARLTGDDKQPWAFDLEEYPGRPFKPCLTMRRILSAAFLNEETEAMECNGERLTLYCDPEVKWGGDKVGGVRISAMSKLPDLNPFPVTERRGKKSTVTIQPLASPTADQPIASLAAEDSEFVDQTTLDLANATSLEELMGYGQILKTKSKPVQDLLRPVYAKRQKELQVQE